MFNNSNLDLLATASLAEESPQTPLRANSEYSRRTFFSRRELNGEFQFSPSAWKTPERPRTGETPFQLGTHHASPSPFFGTPVHYRATTGPSRTPRGVPGLHQSPMGNIGVTPARVMGPFPQRDLFFETTPSPSPISMLGHRRIYTPRSLRENHARGSLEEGDGPDSLEASLFGTAEAPNHSPTPPLSQPLAPFASPGKVDPAPTLLALSIPTTPPPLEADPGQSDVTAVDGMDSDGEEETDTEEDGEGEDEGVHHTHSLTGNIHSQPGAQNETTDDDGNVWLPFPYNRDNLVMYLERGLSLRYLFPSSIHGGRIRCEAELELVGGLWRRAGTCNESKGSLESYQRHIKSRHLGVKRSQEVGLYYIVNTVWGCNKTLPRQPKSWLRVQRWVPNLPGFQFAA